MHHVQCRTRVGATNSLSSPPIFFAIGGNSFKIKAASGAGDNRQQAYHGAFDRVEDRVNHA